MSFVASSEPTATLSVGRESLLFASAQPVPPSATQIAPPVDEQLDLYRRVSERLETPGQTLSADVVMRTFDEG